MKISKVLFGGLTVAFLSVVYNLMVFVIFDFFPDLAFDLVLFGGSIDFFIFVFLKNLFVGMVLTILFGVAYGIILRDRGEAGTSLKAIFFFSVYGVFAFGAFSLGDIVLMRSTEGLLLILTVDGVIESMIATAPIRYFSAER